LIVRGGIEALPELSAAFGAVTVLETWSFMKTMKRQRGSTRDGHRLQWNRSPTPPGAPLDALFAANSTVVRHWIEGRIVKSFEAVRKKAAGAGR
jgi:hypothetical protein